MKRIKAYEKELLLKCLRGEATLNEQQDAWDWIHESEGNRAYYKMLQEAWISNSLNNPVENRQIEGSWKRVEKKIKPQPERSYRERERIFHGTFYISLPWHRLVAAVIFAFILGGIGSIWFYNAQSKIKNQDQYYTIEAPRGAKSMITLTDGSKVWLNAGSRLKYPRTFNQQNRDVFLEGEGYFIVAKNEAINFRVHTSDIVVQALGTEFNVKAYAEEGRIETTLVKGSVSISRNDSPANVQSIVLQPNQKASFFVDNYNVEDIDAGIPVQTANNRAIIKPEPRPARLAIENNINTEVSTSWKEKRWVFERESMKSLATKLERQYDVEIDFRDSELKDFHLTGTLEEESIEQVLMALQLTIPISFEIKHKDVSLSINPKKIDNYKQLLRTKNN
jgi:transmembrane sensor